MDSIEKRIDGLLAEMTLDEKIGQLWQTRSPLEPNEEIFEKLRKGQIGSFIMATTAHAGNDDTESVEGSLLNELQRVAVEESRLGIPVIFGRDVIHGHITTLPLPLASAASFDEELVKKCYRNVAREAARDGVHWTFSPMLDMARDPRWGRCVEGPGEDPYLGSKMGRAIIEGFQGDELSAEDSIAACAKHFLGYGASEGGRDYFRTEISDYTLRNFYLPAFKEAVAAGVQTVMPGFNEISGQPVSSSRHLLTELLKDELGFDGFLISDWTAIPQIMNQGVAADQKDCAEQCFNAGLDMEMVSQCYPAHLKALLAEGKVSLEQIDSSVRRILRVKFKLGLFENPYIPKYKIDFAEHKKNARALSGESIVLLKNKGKLLPLKETASINLAGPMVTDKNNIMGTWALDAKPQDCCSVLEGIKSNCPGCTVNYRATAFDEESLSAVKHKGEVTVLCLGESKMMTGEANSMADISVSPRQVDLVKKAHSLGKPIVAVLFYGRPTDLTEIEPYCDAMVWASHLGTESGNAVADVLFGKVNPSGKLAMSLPRSTGQIPIYYNTTGASRTVNGYYSGCMNYHDCPGKPLYQFGFGLSYSDFELSTAADGTEISLQELEAGKAFKLNVKAKNTSDIAGREVVQLYIRDKVASMSRPMRELKGYKSVYLEANAEQEFTFELGLNELGFYNVKGTFAVEKGLFEIYIGNSCYASKALDLTVI